MSQRGLWVVCLCVGLGLASSASAQEPEEDDGLALVAEACMPFAECFLACPELSMQCVEDCLPQLDNRERTLAATLIFCLEQSGCEPQDDACRTDACFDHLADFTDACQFHDELIDDFMEAAGCDGEGDNFEPEPSAGGVDEPDADVPVTGNSLGQDVVLEGRSSDGQGCSVTASPVSAPVGGGVLLWAVAMMLTFRRGSSFQ